MTTTTTLFTPATDGVDHVNVYSRGKTEAGRLLSNFAHTPFTLHGVRFASVEGFYMSMLQDGEAEWAHVASLFGREAKKWGKKSGKRPGDLVRTWDGRQVPLEGDEFEQEVALALRAKAAQNLEVRAALRATGELPLTHDYVMWGRPIAPRGDRGTLANCLTALREELRRGDAS
jgi:predicted NAD-dependent protein-ADP-ribosyltransferase YbiA (DUF1768 family)